MKILTIVGARPQFIKAAMVSKAIILHNESLPQASNSTITEIILHTGQHYDANMSRIFFDQMGIPKPAYNLRIGSGTHGDTTGKMLTGIEKVILEEKPDWVLVYGDTNSTLAGALAASKLHVPVAHVEAGLRSFNKRMPEEINRILTDHVSTILFCPTITAVKNLANEGITRNVHQIGDVMYDAALTFGALADNESRILSELKLQPKQYYLATVHRAENTDAPKRIKNIFSAFDELATQEIPIIVPLHPRTRKKLIENQIVKEQNHLENDAETSITLMTQNPHVVFIPPVSFLDMVMLEKNAKLILTDSGGVQKEAYFHKVPCVTLRDETEWVETVEAGWNTLVATDRKIQLHSKIRNQNNRQIIYCYGRGDTANMIVTNFI